MIHALAPNEWGLVIPSVPDGTRPLQGPGAIVTPGFNTFGNWTQILAGASVTADVFGIYVNVLGNNASATARDAILTLGIDPAGGTSYTDWISGLAVACASLHGGSSTGFTGGGVSFYFPIRLRAGTSIAAKASVNNATAGTMRTLVRLYCRPSRPEQVWCGSFVDSFGVVAASSNGTSFTPGTTSEGAWTELGTITRPIRCWEVGFGINNSAINNGRYSVDLAVGDATEKRIVLQDAYVEFTALEAQVKHVATAFGHGAVGEKIYGRAQGTTADAGVSLIAYGCG